MNKIISLVPSITESLFDLGIGPNVIGVSDYCVLPETVVCDIPKVGGPKRLDLEMILSLQPDIVLANQEENDRLDILFLSDAGINVKLFFPKTPRDVIVDLYDLLEICGNLGQIETVRAIEQALDWVETSYIDQPQFRYFCPIWFGEHAQAGNWLMTFNQDTYPSALLKIFGGENIFSSRERKYPLDADLGFGESEPTGERDTRYPCIPIAEIIRSAPDIILVPDEPYSFSPAQIDLLIDAFKQEAIPVPKIVPLDGSILFWPGTRLAKALTDLPEMIHPQS